MEFAAIGGWNDCKTGELSLSDHLHASPIVAGASYRSATLSSQERDKVPNLWMECKCWISDNLLRLSRHLSARWTTGPWVSSTCARAKPV